MEGYDKIGITRDNKRRLDYKIDLLRFDTSGVTRSSPFQVVNSCRGFLLIRSEYGDMRHKPRLHVYNPLTSEHLKLPYLETDRWRISILGLGFGAITEKYKVVCVYYTSCGDVEILVHTVGTNEWRRVETNKVYWRLHEQGTMIRIGKQLAMNSVLYWLHYLVHRMGCFDIDKEEINTIAMPSLENTENIPVYIEMIHGMLSLSILDADHKNLQIWVMRNHGEQESWTKYIVLKNHNVARNRSLSNFCPKLVDVRDNGEMVVLPHDLTCQIALYDPKGNGFKWPRDRCSRVGNITYTYMPSFLSIGITNTAKFEAAAN